MVSCYMTFGVRIALWQVLWASCNYLYFNVFILFCIFCSFTFPNKPCLQ